MSLPRYPQVTQELLSAYLDDAVSAEERELVERAVRHDADVAQQLESLRQTVQLLQTLPAVSLPRSFTLTAVMVEAAEEKAAAAARATQRHRAAERAMTERQRTVPNWWQRLLTAFSGFTPLRNAIAVVLLLLVALYVGNWSFLRIDQVASVQTVGQQVASAPNADVVRATSAEASSSAAVESTDLYESGEAAAMHEEVLPNENQETVAEEAIETVEAIETNSSVPADGAVADTDAADTDAGDTDVIADTTLSASTPAIGSAATTGETTEQSAATTAGEPTAPLAFAPAEPMQESMSGFPGASGRNAQQASGPERPGEDTQPLNPGQPPQVAVAQQNPTATAVNRVANSNAAENTPPSNDADLDTIAESAPATSPADVVNDGASDENASDGVVVAAGSGEAQNDNSNAEMRAVAKAEATVAEVVGTVAAEAMIAAGNKVNEDEIAESQSEGNEGEESEPQTLVAANQAFSSTIATPPATTTPVGTVAEQLAAPPTFTPTLTATSTITATVTPTPTVAVTLTGALIAPAATSPVATPTPTATPLAHGAMPQVASVAISRSTLAIGFILAVPLLFVRKREDNA